MINPLKLSVEVNRVVCREEHGIFLRRYWRFRGGKWYGGIATADCVGCNLRCKFCGPVLYMTKNKLIGEFRTPEEVVRRLVNIAFKRKYRYIRISGGEPTICIEHLFQLLEIIGDYPFIFILETNGILIGHDKSIAKRLSSYENVHVRVSLKGTNREEFQRLSMAYEEFFDYQLRALENLLNYGVSFHPAVVASFISSENINKLKKVLAEIDKEMVENLEIEYIVLYPHVIESLKRHGLVPTKAYTVDWELIDSNEFIARYL
ncbi:MAG: radical SAM protein [Candidatus Njordarchaeales archaeon]